MDFGSRYIYKYDLSDEECISDDEFDEGMELSDSDEDEAPSGSASVRRSGLGAGFLSLFSGSGSRGGRNSDGAKRKCKKKHHWRIGQSAYVQTTREVDGPTPQKKGRRYRRADTNVVKIKFETLKKPSHMHTGDAEYCTNCQAVLSRISKLEDVSENEKSWTCEFCSHLNSVDLMPDEIPKEKDVTYMLEPAPATTATSKSGVDESLIIFCIDISGSMCVTTEVPGKIRLRGDRLDRMQSLNDEHENQFMPGQSRNVTYVSRLQGVQAAIDKQLADMEKEHADRRVALITFNDEVTVVGDGDGEPVHLAKHKLTDKEELIKIGSELSLPKAVKESRTVLGDKVFDLEEGGATALGPALLLSVAMAAQAPGSKVIICTDGKANVGIGSLDDNSKEQEEEADKYYKEVSTLASDKGVSVSVISIKGADCKLVHLGGVADRTGGQVNIVDPLQLTSQFGSILADPVIATGVVAKFITHKGLYIREDSRHSTKDNCVVREVGNVTADTEISFEFGVCRSSETKPTPSAESSEAVAGPSTEAEPSGASGSSKGAAEQKDPEELPFQLQITYTDIEGAKALRVLTQCQPVTKERKVAEEYLNLGVMGTHVAQRSAALASAGMYTDARSCALMQQRLMSRHKSDYASQRPEIRHAYNNVFSKVKKLENNLNAKQKSEVMRTGSRYSDDEDDSADAPLVLATSRQKCGAVTDSACGYQNIESAAVARRQSFPKGKARVKSAVRRARTAECDDDLASTTYQLKKTSFSSLLKKK